MSYMLVICAHSEIRSFSVLNAKKNIEYIQMKSKNIDDDRETQVTQQSSKYSTLDDPEVQAQNKELYKVFGRETAIGKELFGLFNAYDKPKIAYPKPKQKTQEQIQAEKTKQVKGCPQKTQIQYPTQEIKQEPTIHPVDLIKKRKPEAEIRKEIEAYYAGQKFFRPLKGGVDRQKLIEALQQIFKHKRGALPKGAELPEVNVKDAYLDDNETRTNAIKRTHKKYIFSLKDDEEDRFAQLEADPLTELEVLFSEIVKEIQERQEFLEEIQPLDEPKLKQKIKDEIIERVSELQKVQELKKHYK